MDKKDYHLISLKFLSAILMALFFAFLLVFVFAPETRDSYPAYSFERDRIRDSRQINVFSEDQAADLSPDFSGKEEFETGLISRSFEIMEASKRAMLTVITSNYLDRINGLKEEEDLLLTELKLRLNTESEQLLQQKRAELETELSVRLQEIRSQVREKYAGYSQREIRDNYLKMINLRIAVEVLARDENEKDRYQDELEQVEREQDQLLAEKNSVLNDDISAETRSLIMDFNREFAEYRQQIENEHQQLIQARETEIEEKLAAYREEIRVELSTKREEKSAAMDQLIAKSKEYY